MQVQPSSARSLPGSSPEDPPLSTETLSRIWELLHTRQLLEHAGAEKPAWIPVADVGALLLEVERLQDELAAARDLRHQGGELVDRTLLAAYEVLARDMARYREIQDLRLSKKVTDEDCRDAWARCNESLGMCARVRGARSWSEVLKLSTDELRALAGQQ